MPNYERILEAWAAFPATETPRPLVILDGYVRIADSGFVTADAKRAFSSGRIDSRTPLPSGLAELLGVTNARTAADRVSIDGVEETTSSFLTDRGREVLPAFELHTPATHQPIIVLDPETPVWWPAQPTGRPAAFIGTATVDSDDMTLRVPATGSVLTEFLGCEFVESTSAVVAVPETRERTMQPDETIDLIEVVKTVAGRLRQPLGGRVLVDASGSPTAVLQSDL